MENLTITEILIRMILGMLFSGILGYEREQKGRPAGFRTYIVVCMGAEIAMMTGIYLKIYMGDPDSSRIAAQVISGISFLGAGTILVTKQNQVKTFKFIKPDVLYAKWEKNLEEEDLNLLAEEALQQITTLKYDADMREDGITDILRFGIAFSGKKVRVKTII